MRAHIKSHLIPTYVQPCTAYTYTKSYVVPSREAFSQTLVRENINLEDTDNSKRTQKNNTLQGGFEIFSFASFLFVAGALIILEKLYDQCISKDATMPATCEKLKKVDLNVNEHASFIKAICAALDRSFNIISKNRFKSGEHVPITHGISIPFTGSLDHAYAQINVQNINFTFFQDCYTINYKFLYDPNLRLTPKMLNKFEVSVMKNMYDNQITWRTLHLSAGDAPGVINFKITINRDKIFCYPESKK